MERLSLSNLVYIYKELQSFGKSESANLFASLRILHRQLLKTMKALYFSLILIFVAFQLPSQSKPKFELGAKWTYEQIVRVPPKVDFVTYEIIDTLTIDSMSCYMLDQFNIVFCVDGNRVYGNRVFGPGDCLLYTSPSPRD